MYHGMLGQGACMMAQSAHPVLEKASSCMTCVHAPRHAHHHTKSSAKRRPCGSQQSTLAMPPTPNASQLSTAIGPYIVSPGCPGALLFWIREATFSIAPWTVLIGLALPLPLKHAALAQAAVLAVALAGIGSRCKLSFMLCPDSGRRYRQAVRALSVAVACILPIDLGHAAQQWDLSAQGSFQLLHLFTLSIAYCLVTALLHRWEWSHRQLFARQHRLAPEACALLRHRDQQHLGPCSWFLLAAVLWLLSQCMCVLL